MESNIALVPSGVSAPGNFRCHYSNSCRENLILISLRTRQSSCSSIKTVFCMGVNDVCARPRVISGFGVERPFGLSEETSLGAVEGMLNMGVFGRTEAVG